MLRQLVQFRQAILVLLMRMPGTRMYNEPGLQKSRSQTGTDSILYERRWHAMA